jgi:hypothetical protein
MGIVSSVIHVGEPVAFVDDFICAVTKDWFVHRAFRLGLDRESGNDGNRVRERVRSISGAIAFRHVGGGANVGS